MQTHPCPSLYIPIYCHAHPAAAAAAAAAVVAASAHDAPVRVLIVIPVFVVVCNLGSLLILGYVFVIFFSIGFGYTTVPHLRPLVSNVSS
jgi:hypothetical protein